MKIHKIKIYLVAISLSLLLPSLSSAYFTTTQTANRLTDDTVLFTVSYKFGLKNRGLYMPIAAIRNGNGSTNMLEYQIQSDEEAVKTGTAFGLALTGASNVSIVNGRYFVPAGENAEFTFVSIYKADNPADIDDLSLLVTHLPFTMVVDGVDYNNKLNPSELKYYQTPVID